MVGLMSDRLFGVRWQGFARHRFGLSVRSDNPRSKAVSRKALPPHSKKVYRTLSPKLTHYLDLGLVDLNMRRAPVSGAAGETLAACRHGYDDRDIPRRSEPFRKQNINLVEARSFTGSNEKN